MTVFVLFLNVPSFDATTRPSFADSTNRQLIINQETIRLWGIPTPAEAIGKRVAMWGHDATIRGGQQLPL